MGEYLHGLPAAAALLLHTDMDGLMRSPTDLAGYRLLNRRDGEDEFREEWRDGAAAVELFRRWREELSGGAEAVGRRQPPSPWKGPGLGSGMAAVAGEP
jgi:hypothetical protein